MCGKLGRSSAIRYSESFLQQWHEKCFMKWFRVSSQCIRLSNIHQTIVIYAEHLAKDSWSFHLFFFVLNFWQILHFLSKICWKIPQKRGLYALPIYEVSTDFSIPDPLLSSCLMTIQRDRKILLWFHMIYMVKYMLKKTHVL